VLELADHADEVILILFIITLTDCIAVLYGITFVVYE
jgi:hypothetical protein